MVSIVPFSGGCYGYVRCSLGPTIGYFTGMVEASKYILYTVSSCNLIGRVFMMTLDFDYDTWMPVIWLGMFVLAVLIPLLGNKVIWWCWGALKFGKTEYLGPEYNKLETGFDNFLLILPYAALLFSGIDDVRTCANDVSNKIVPWAMVLVMCSNIVVAIGVVVAARAYSSDTSSIMRDMFPLSTGITATMKSVNPQYVSFFCLPLLFGNFLGMVYGGGRQLRSMACSGLLPSFLATVSRDTAVMPVLNASGKGESVKEVKPLVAIIVCSILSYVIVVACYFKVDGHSFGNVIMRSAGLQASIESWGAMGAYIVFATRFDGMNRGFRSPFGIAGALSMMCFSCFVVKGFFQKDPRARFENTNMENRSIGISVGIFFGVCLIYYILVVNKRQFFSKEEQDNFMKAYVVNANKKKRSGKRSKRSLLSLWSNVSLNLLCKLKTPFQTSSSKGKVATIASKGSSDIHMNGMLLIKPGVVANNQVVPQHPSFVKDEFSGLATIIPPC
eukprot:scaffold602_cov179-Ochromonas_danica.AAC.23